MAPRYNVLSQGKNKVNPDYFYFVGAFKCQVKHDPKMFMGN